jgi:uncharacterized protein YjbI with pentapeptide repeats
MSLLRPTLQRLQTIASRRIRHILLTERRVGYSGRKSKVAMGVHLIGVHLTGVYLMGVYLTGAYLTGVYLIGVHLIGVHLMGVHLMGVY